MGWAARLNPVARDASIGTIAQKPRAVRPVSKREDEFLGRWFAMWDRVHGVRVDIQPRVNPITQQVA